MSQVSRYVVAGAYVEVREGTLYIRPAGAEEKNATAVGSFSFKVGDCRIRMSEAKGLQASVGDHRKRGSHADKPDPSSGA